MSLPKIELKRTVEVESYRVVGDIGRAQRQPHLLAVLRLASEGDGHVSAKQISSALLGDRPKSVGQRLLNLCTIYRLIDGGELTKAGWEALETSQVFIPERGVWTIRVVCDPLIPNRVIECKPYNEPPAHADALNHASDDRIFGDLPDILAGLIGDSCVPVGNRNSDALFFERFESKCEVLEEKYSLQLSLTLDSAQRTFLSLEGPLSGSSLDVRLDPPELSHEKVGLSLLDSEGLLEDWDMDRSRLAKKFNEVPSSSSRKSFAITQTFSSPKIESVSFNGSRQSISVDLPELGEFDSTEVDEVPVMPAGQEDADQWARWLLQRGIDGYISSTEYTRRTQSLGEDFTAFGFSPDLPTADELAHELAANPTDEPHPAQYWYLQAPLDWQLEDGGER